MEQQEIYQKGVHSQINPEPQYQALFSNWLNEFKGFFVINPKILEDAGVQLEQTLEKEQE